jgi:hypothetical protein
VKPRITAVSADDQALNVKCHDDDDRICIVTNTHNFTDRRREQIPPKHWYQSNKRSWERNVKINNV